MMGGFKMKKSYTTPSFEILNLEDVLANSDLDNIAPDDTNDNYDDESGWMIAD